ncbi:hypothetical protein Vadar_024856 [Vaccinium darrowii]|uniref:Uncharacterized protein n=1 Tax=Vaccinium darrowii TaxID=229202 RepID=A0ACB7YGB2_9ERIC|nr:hypothetical protein Vadar_024856 [Vaccinium darrowii]
MAVGVVSVPIPNDTYKLGFIGADKMAESIAKGVGKLGVLLASRIRTAHLGSSSRAAFESFGVKVFKRNVEVLPYPLFGVCHLCLDLLQYLQPKSPG